MTVDIVFFGAHPDDVEWGAGGMALLLAGKLTLYACPSLLENIGYDGTETHGQNPGLTNTQVTDHRIQLENIPLIESEGARKLICRHLYRKMGIRARWKKWLNGGLKS